MQASKFGIAEHKNWRNYDDENLSMYEERDFQRQKAYRAENSVRYQMINNNRYDSIEEIKKRVDKICSYKWFKDRWGERNVKVIYKSKGSALGNYGIGYIKLPKWAWNDLVILHELAHAITPPETGGQHGRYWAATFLELVEKVMGKADYIILREAFKKNDVKYKQKRRLSEETKIKMRSHMEEIRKNSPIVNNLL